jgi:hypothetical protein
MSWADAAMLNEVLEQLGPEAARELQKTLKAEIRSDRRQRRVVRKLHDLHEQIPRTGRRRSLRPVHD